MKLNKRGATFSAITEAILVVMIVVITFTVIIADQDLMYGGNNSASIPFGTETLDMVSSFQNQSSSGQSAVQGGSVTNDVLGLNWGQTWAMLVGFFTIMWAFVNGSWIPTILQNVFFGFSGTVGGNNAIWIIGQIIRFIFIAGLIYAVIRIVTRVRP